jgi:hypothetical protein
VTIRDGPEGLQRISDHSLRARRGCRELVTVREGADGVAEN